MDRRASLRTRSRARRSTLPEAGSTRRGGWRSRAATLVELASEFGTPAYIYAEAEMRARARLPTRPSRSAAARTSRSSSRARRSPVPRPTGSSPRRGCPSTSPPAASSTPPFTRGFDPARIHMHGNNKSDEEILFAARRGRRPPDPRLASMRSTDASGCSIRRQRVLIRVTPGIKPSTHDYVQTGQLDSKFGFGLEDGLAAQAIERVLASDLELVGLHAHIGSQIFELEAYRLAIQAIGDSPATGAGMVNVGGGLGIAYMARGRAPVGRFLRRGQGARRAEGSVRVLVEPGRSLVGNAGHHRLPGRDSQGDPRHPHPTSPSTAACRTTCGRCSTGPGTKP